MKTQLSIGIESDDMKTQIINDQGQHVCYIELSDTKEIAETIINSFNNYDAIKYALEGLTKEVKLSKLNIRKDFSLINAHAYALKALHYAESEP